MKKNVLSRRQFFQLTAFGTLLALASQSRMATAITTNPARLDFDNFPQNLRLGHPRLILLDDDIQALHTLIASDTTAQKLYRAIQKRADSQVKQPVVTYAIKGAQYLLTTARTVLDRIYTLGLVYRLDKAPQYAERARQELLAAAAFKDWDPAHFLDTAELSHAVGIGYDWFYDTLSEADRTTIRNALTELGIKAGLQEFARNTWWTTSPINWNTVCNGGLSIGALAVADEVPEATTLLKLTLASVQHSLITYGPDGGWPEGPGYWGYATDYAVSLFAAMQTALGSDEGFSNTPGFDKTGMYLLNILGPTGQPFNFADDGDNQALLSPTPTLFWLAQRFNNPVLAWQEQQLLPKSSQPRDLIWYTANTQAPEDAKLPLVAQFTGVKVVSLRSAWDDPDALFVGFKGGDNQANHGHLDLGTFVLDGLRQRWAIDLGADDYGLPGYFDTKKQRWTYYRCGTAGHNTLVINNTNQRLDGQAPVLVSGSSADRSFAAVDLTNAYQGLHTAQRGIALLSGQHVLVQDEIDTMTSVDLVWQMHTMATIQVDTQDGKTALLTLKDVTLYAHILTADGHFEIASAAAAAPQNPNAGVQKLIIHLPQFTKGVLAVLFTPTRASVPPTFAPTLQPLSTWR